MNRVRNRARLSGMLFASFFIFSFSSAQAATEVSGTLTSDTTWTVAGSPYVASNVTVPVGVTLTINPGVVVKVPLQTYPIQIEGGALIVGAPDSEKVIITSVFDDSVGGDLNDSPSTGTAREWAAIRAYGGTVSLTRTELRFGGYDNRYGELYNVGATVIVSQSEFSDTGTGVVTDGGTTEVRDSTFRRAISFGVRQQGGILRLARNVFEQTDTAGYSTGGSFQSEGGNVAVDNQILLSGARTGDDHTILAKDSVAYVLNSYGVSGEGSLDILPGTVVKMLGTPVSISGGTLTIGTAGFEKVILTSYDDDTVGGDTNRNGAVSVPQPGDWCDMNLRGGTVSVVNALIRYGGCLNTGQITNNGAVLTVKDSQFFSSGQYHIYQLSGSLALSRTELAYGQFGFGYRGGDITLLHTNSFHDNSQYGVVNIALNPVIDATDNWWGSDAGPFHPTINPGGLGNNEVSDSVAFDPWLHADPFLDFPLCTENCYSNVLFLPGLQASRLYAGGEKLWEPGSNGEVEELFLDSDGKSKRDDIVTKDVIDEKPNGGNIYKSFLADLESWKTDEQLIEDYTVAPYDWRLTLDDIVDGGKKNGDDISYLKSTDTPYIISELRRLAGTSKSGKVTLIAHSNGGLVAKGLTEKLGSEAAQLIDKIVFVGVPQSGTPKAIGALLHGYDQGLPYDWFFPLLSPKTARMFAQNMPSAYHLLPSQDYFTGEGSGVDTPVVTFDSGATTDSYINKYGKKVDSFSELHDFLLDSDNKVPADSDQISIPSVVNTDLFSYGNGVHDDLDSAWSLPAGVKIYQIAGFGEETPATIRYWTGKKCAQALPMGQCIAYEPKLEYTPEMVVDGDGTVLAPSALAMGTSSNVTRWWVDLGKYNIPFLRSVDHADLLEVSQLRDFIKQNILTSISASLPEFLNDSEPPINSGKRLKFYLHSPLALSAHDQDGHEISASVSTLPGARYERFGEVQYISVPADSAPTLALDGESEGSFTLEVQEASEGEVTSQTTFESIPTKEATEVTMDFPDGTIENAEPLVIDYDGNGIPEFSLEPKPGETVVLPSLDETPPEARVFFDPVTSSVKVEGIDADGPVTVVTTEGTKAKKKPKDSSEQLVTTTLTDPSGNTTTLTYKMHFPERERRATLEFVSISYNGEVTNFSDTLLRYKWLKQKETYRLFASYVRVPDRKLEAHYRPKKNITVIMAKPEDLDENDDDSWVDSKLTREKLAGLVIPYLETKKGEVTIKY